MFIKVTEHGGGGIIFLNTAHILSISPYVLRGVSDTSLIVYGSSGMAVRVDESIDEIMKLIEGSENEKIQ